MPKTVASKEVIEETAVNKNVEKPKKGRTMTPEMLEKLKLAREKAILAKRDGKKINDELEKAKKETFSEKIDQVETYHKLKAKVEDEVKQNEIVAINQRLNDMHSKFDGFLQDRQQRKVEKAQRKQEKSGKELARALPAELAKKMIQQELREQQLREFRYNMFGI
jgi:ATP-dependent Clp protease ATP-binding subunit ClpA